MNSLQPTTFSQQIQKFILLEEELSKLQDQMKKLREEKMKTQTQITETMNERSWQKQKIEAGSYELSMIERKQYGTLTFSYLEETLPKIIPDKSQVDYVIQFLKSNRTIKTNQEIKMHAVGASLTQNFAPSVLGIISETYRITNVSTTAIKDSHSSPKILIA